MDSSPPTTPIKTQTLTLTLNSPSPIKPSSPLHLTIHDLLLLPSSPNPNFRHIDPPPPDPTPHRKSKNRAPAATAQISPRNGRRARRRPEKEIGREERLVGQKEEDDVGKIKKRRQSRPRSARNETLMSFIQSLPSSSLKTIPEQENSILNDQIRLEGICETVSDLLMWKNAAKSSLWFGFGSILFLSTIFSGDVGFSIISVASHLGILILSLAFFKDTIRQRKQDEKKPTAFQLTEEKILQIIRIVLPLLNVVLSKSQKAFSGEPMMTLKVAPVLIFMAKYGHFTTPWRLLAIGFFMSFTAPKLYSCYYQEILQRVEEGKSCALHSWRSCSRKKLVVISAAALLWNVFSVKMRIFAAFITVVILRYHHEQQPFIQEYAVEENVNNKEDMEGEMGEEESCIQKGG